MPNAASTAQIRVIIADDHRMVVESFARMLGRRYAIVGTAFNGIDLLELLRTRSADCLILDIDMPGRNGLQLIPDVLKLRPELRIVMVTMLVDRCVADAALAVGALAFVPKDAPLQELERAIAEALAGATYISPRVPKSSHRVSLDARHKALHRLTPRQQQIVLLLGEGRSCTEIAKLLHLGPSTVTFHKHNIMRILALGADRELLRYAVLLRESAAGSSRPVPANR